uniref:Glutaredoxin-like protein n=1 Tax=Monopterus albus TaxID=43700 RepID=A0A3Q3J3T8_MONAL
APNVHQTSTEISAGTSPGLPLGRKRDVRPDSDPCPLCDEAKRELEPLKHRFVLQQVDISLPENRMWLDRYRWDIPVFHLNGQFVMKHRVDIVLRNKLLQEAETDKTR